jgi:HD-GYP domain-containing protein (c-di-GMP phosphodiesterase class II)
MPFAELSAVKHRLHLNAPLPFNVRNADKTLLLARGQMVRSASDLDSLLQRGALVDLSELMSPRDEIKQAPREALPRLWRGALNKASQALNVAPTAGLAEAINDAAAPLQALVERDPDLAIFQVLQRGAQASVSYGAQRSMQTAIASMLVANRLGWQPAQAERAFKVALTMNLSMLELQGTLAEQNSPPSAEQREELTSHPLRSVRMLQQAGVADVQWLDAVLHHHEVEDGSGYPSGVSNENGVVVSEIASLARRADVYTAKLSERAARGALAADQASRQMFMQDPTHAITTALVKEFGIYPPGCYVRLVSGEVGVVLERGTSITSPVVAAFINERGVALKHPVRRQTAELKYAVAAVVPAADLQEPMSLEKILVALA